MSIIPPIPNAAAVGAVPVERLTGFMTEKMLARYKTLEFPAKSAIIAAFPFYTGSNTGNIAQFARVPDYHEIVYSFMREAVGDNKRLLAVRNGWPLPLVSAARLAGVGFTGRHGLQIVEPYGSYVALGAILCDSVLEYGQSGGQCAGCGACERACPTGAMRFENGIRVLDRSLCIASITQAKNAARLDLLKCSGYIWGCDICQSVCPHNRDVPLTCIPEFRRCVINSIDPSEPVPEDRHYSGRQELLRRNKEALG